MNSYKQNDLSSLKKISATIDKIDQNIEEWVHYFINQIEQESYNSNKNREGETVDVKQDSEKPSADDCLFCLPGHASTHSPVQSPLHIK